MTSVTSTSSSPPRGWVSTPNSLESWQRPRWSVASTRSCASVSTAHGFVAFSSALPFGVASTSCWRPSAAFGLLGQVADGCPATNLGDDGVTWPFFVSCTIVCPPPFGPIASVPTDANVSPPWVK